MIKIIFKMFKDIIVKIRKAYVLRKYDDFTIAEYFRKQGASIGENNRIMIRSLGDDPYLIKIGNHCSISSGVSFITHDGSGWIFTHELPSLQRFGKIEIKDNCYIGLRCIILPDVTIGPNSIVGAGSVVTKNVPPNTVVAGNPAKVIKSIELYKKKVTKIWKKQRPPRYLEQLKENIIYSPAVIHSHKLRLENRKKLFEHFKKIVLNNFKDENS